MQLKTHVTHSPINSSYIYRYVDYANAVSSAYKSNLLPRGWFTFFFFSPTEDAAVWLDAAGTRPGADLLLLMTADVMQLTGLQRGWR